MRTKVKQLVTIKDEVGEIEAECFLKDFIRSFGETKRNLRDL